jgi:cytochrome c556
MRTIITLGTALACALSVAATSVAQPTPPTPEEQAAAAVATRQSVFKLLSWNMAPFAGMMRGQTPFDAALIKTRAVNIAGLAPMIPDLFATDTSAFELETRALDNIWTNKADFDSHPGELVEAANALGAAADSGDEAAIRAAIQGVGAVCSSCHDDYRQE